MRLSPLFLAPPLSGLYDLSWKQLAEQANHPEKPPARLVARQTPFEHIMPNIISLPLDHAGETSTRFDNRFWLNAMYYEPGGPVIFFDIGESAGQSLADQYLTGYPNPSPVMALAQRYKGIAIAWEHRFYGESFPRLWYKNFSDEWKYHTVQQALDDTVFFANKFANETSSSSSQTDPFQRYAIHPSKVPWIAVSGSYPGARISFLREKHPEIIFAGWGSSVCSGGEIRSPGYYSVIQSTLPANCSADWAAIRQYVDDLLKDNSTDAQTKLRFGGDDEINALTLPTGGFQSVGPEMSTNMFCDELESRNRQGDPSPEGIVATSGVEVAYGIFADIVGPVLDRYKTIQTSWEEDPDYVSWIYQECVELGGFRVHDPDNPNSFVSSLVTEESISETCRRMFPGDFVPAKPRVEALNDLGGWDINPSNFLFTDGELDPWRIVTPSWPKKQGTIRTWSETIPKCNARPPLERYYGKVYAGTAHMPEYKIMTPADMYIGFEDIYLRNVQAFNQSMDMFQKALDEWLPCYGKSAPGHDGVSGGTGGAQALQINSALSAITSLIVLSTLYLYL